MHIMANDIVSRRLQQCDLFKLSPLELLDQFIFHCPKVFPTFPAWPLPLVIVSSGISTWECHCVSKWAVIGVCLDGVH